MAQWLRYTHQGKTGFGTVEDSSAGTSAGVPGGSSAGVFVDLPVDGTIHVHTGDLFNAPVKTGATLRLSEVTLLAPCTPSKMPALWNNFHERAVKEGNPVPAHPLYFLKTNNSFCAHGTVIVKPPQFNGKVVFEAELGIVIGKRASRISVADAPAHIFGYTCVNDVTAADILREDKTFEQWTRAKGFDTFCPFGPVITTGVAAQELHDLRVKAILVQPGGEVQERQNYPVADMVFSPAEQVSLISQDMTLEPGDIIACGTSVGAGAMKPGSVIRIEIPGVGMLENRYAA